MSNVLKEAFGLLAVGMGSAFFVLFLISILGRLLIRWINGTVKEESGTLLHSSKNNSAESQHIAALTSVVDIITDGEGSISNIQKIHS